MMRKFSLFIATILLCAAAFAQQAWKASEYHGLLAGKSNKAAVTKAFGEPSETRKPSLFAFANEACCEELVFHGKGENCGDL